MLRLLPIILCLGVLLSSAAAAGVPAPTPSYIPLTDLGTGTYRGMSGGLYPDGQNQPPPAHLRVGLGRAGTIEPLNNAGQPDPQGKIVLLSIGMSNTTMEFSVFRREAILDPERNPRLAVVDGAQGGQDATRIKDPNSPFWQFVGRRLSEANATPAQVQAVWLKEAIAGENRPFPADAQGLAKDLQAIALILAQRFPHLQLAYLSSRTYAGYATTKLNPEPYAYESGFAVKWLIEAQIKGVAGLNADPARGRIEVPWMAWGPYLWTNGTPGRGDGLTWEPADVSLKDGTHPSLGGQRKVARLLLDFFKTDVTAKTWFCTGQS